MRRFRFHIGTLVILVLLIGVGLTALRESSEIWDSGVFTLAIGVLLISALLAIHRTEKKRAFWLGFALFGSAYLTLSVIPSLESRLITTQGLAFLGFKMPVPNSTGSGLAFGDFDDDGILHLLVANDSGPNELYLSNGNGMFQDITNSAGFRSRGNRVFLKGLAGARISGSTENFVSIGHSLIAIVAAIVGGNISRHLYRTGRQAIQPTGSIAQAGPVDGSP
jgi:hypothetical protein